MKHVLFWPKLFEGAVYPDAPVGHGMGYFCGTAAGSGVGTGRIQASSVSSAGREGNGTGVEHGAWYTCRYGDGTGNANEGGTGNGGS